ncbi:MAG: HPr family phosphocarrier protein [Lachnospiraceae bacterium]|nr:HPr family phosphocarrier protein [Candidatus Colinaster equi]
MKFLQRIGKSLMLPVSVLPICGILMGIGYLLCPASMQGNEVVGVTATIGFVLVKAGGAIIDNIGWLFAIGVSVGMSDDNHGASALSGLVSYLIITTLLSASTVLTVFPRLDPNGIMIIAFSKIQNPFIAIFAGVLAATCYNRYKTVNLPKYLSFFSGRRFVIIVAALYSLVAVCVLAVVWPLAFNMLTMLGRGIVGLGGIGVGIYTFLNRLLIPFGLHHALNNVFWFDTIGIGDLTAFWAGKTSEQVGWSLGMYMSGFFPCMMFGIPGAALAMIRRAKNRKKAFANLFSSSVCSFVCGVTEPFEFSFMFSAFPLYVVYSALYGIFATITYYTGFRAGFSFSAGATDLLFSASLPAADKTWQIIPLGILAFVTFYLVFTLMLKWKKYPIFGSEEEETSSNAGENKVSDDYMKMSKLLLEALGGAENLTSIDCCATRLRLEVKDTDIINHGKIKDAGAIESHNVGKDACQIVIGVTVQQVCEALKAVAGAESKQSIDKPEHEIDLTDRKKLKRGEILTFDMSDTFEIVITNSKGIHARPAAYIVDVAKRFKSELIMTYEGKSASLKSSTQIMALGVVCGAKVAVFATGEDNKEAIEAVKSAIKTCNG